MEAARHDRRRLAPGSAGRGANGAAAGTPGAAGGSLARGAGVAHHLFHEVPGVHCWRGRAGWARVGGVW